MRVKQRSCMVCKTGTARRLKPRTPYEYYAQTPVFCSVRCAADYGLNVAGTSLEAIPMYCRECDSWSTVGEGDGGNCIDCGSVMED